MLKVKRGGKIVAYDVQNLCFYKISPNKWIKLIEHAYKNEVDKKENIAKIS